MNSLGAALYHLLFILFLNYNSPKLKEDHGVLGFWGVKASLVREEGRKKNETQRNNLNTSHEHKRAYTPEFKILTFGKVRAWG
jgi:hypothetical protein